ncbi:MAG: transposase [Pyrinomonadaceae bacterium]|nr:transposase [Pyrinomonadaceae bacterium]
MARALRAEFPGAWYHVTARGNERRAIFRSDVDRGRLLQLLAECIARFGWRLHAYAFMSNHYHLMVETPGGGLSRAMQWLNVSYTVWFNRKHGRCGHLFQGRFKAFLVEAESWGLELSRYVHLNPVRVARLGLGKGHRAQSRAGQGDAAPRALIAVRREELRKFRWSSYRAYIGLDKAPPWLLVEEVRGQAGGARGKSVQAYRAYVEEALRDGLAESPLEKVEAQLVLGGAALLDKVRRVLGEDRRREQTGARTLRRREFGEVIAVVSALKAEPWESFRDRYGDWGRDLALWLGRTQCGLKLRELGEEAGGIDYATVSAATARWTKRAATDRQLRKWQNRALQILNAKM